MLVRAKISDLTNLPTSNRKRLINKIVQHLFYLESQAIQLQLPTLLQSKSINSFKKIRSFLQRCKIMRKIKMKVKKKISF
jgi:hypothetical protein